MDGAPDLAAQLDTSPMMGEQDDSTLPWYLAAAEDVVGHLDEREDEYFKVVSSASLTKMWRVAWAQYFGSDPDRPGEMATQIVQRVGEEKEYTKLRINEARSFAAQAMQTAIGSRPAFKAMTESQEFAALAGIDGIDRAIQHVMKTAWPNKQRRRLLERGYILGMGFAHVRWNALGGDDTTEQKPVNGPDGQPMVGAMGIPITEDVEVKSGEPVISVGCPWDCFYDVQEEEALSWICIRERRSKWELAALFPEHAETLTKLGGQDNYSRERLFGGPSVFDSMSSNDDKVTLKHFYLARAPGADDGRYIGFVDECMPLWDRTLPIQASGQLPVQMVMSEPYIGALLGYASWWDIISIQQGIDNSVSDWATNIRAFGRLNILNPKGSGINWEAWRKGVRVIDVNPGSEGASYMQPPKLDGATDFLNYMHRRMESVSQQNAVRRGDPQANIKSGTMAALFNQISIEYMSNVQESFDDAEQGIANIVLELVRTRSKGEFMVQVAGENSRPYWEAFNAKESLKGVRSVHIESISPMMRSPAGRYAAFEAIERVEPDKKAAVLRGLDTGDWSGYAEVDSSTDMRIVSENELLLQGKKPMVGANDRHDLHVPKHDALFQRLEAADPTIIGDPPIDPMTGQPMIDPMTGQPVPGQPIPGKYDKQKRAILEHMLEHSNQWQLVDPRMCALLKMPPPPPMPGTPSGDLMMMTGGGAPPAAAGPGGPPTGPDGAPMPDDGSGPPQGQPDQPKPAQPPQPPQQGAPS